MMTLGFGPVGAAPISSLPSSEDDVYERARQEIIAAAERGNVTELNLSGYRLNRLPPEIGRLTDLQTLNLSDNDFSELPIEIWQLPALQQLELARNHITSLSSEIGKLTSLKDLDLHDNDVATLPAELWQLVELQRLNLSYNCIERLPQEIGKLTDINMLFLDANLIDAIPAEIGLLSSLEYLSIEANRVKFLPPEIGNLNSLKDLYLSGNQIDALPVEIGQLVALETLSVGENQLSDVPKEIGQLANLINLDISRNNIKTLPIEMFKADHLLMAAENGTESDPRGLHLDRNPLVEPFPKLIAQGQPSATINVFAWMRGQLDLSSLPEEIDPPASSSIDADIPDIPPQAVGPHFALDDRSVVTFAPLEAIDADGNNVARLRKLHPTLRALAEELVFALGKGNVPHHSLRDRADSYHALIDTDLSAIDFALLFQAGLRLANAERAATADEELPSLSATAREAVESLLALHGTFILSTREGLESIALEERYRRNPREDAAYRREATAFADELKARPDLVDPRVAEVVRKAADEIGKGGNPERSGVSATGTVKNVTITIGAAAVLGSLSATAVASGSPLAIVGAGVGMLVAGEGLKKSKAFAAVAALIARGLDQASETNSAKAAKMLAKRLKPQHDFLLSIEPRLRSLSEQRDELRWLAELLEWLRKERR